AFLVSAALAAAFAAAAASSFDFASALALSSCVPASAALAAALCFSSSARALAWSVFAGGERLVGERQLRVGAGLEPLQLAQRRRERCCLACRCRGVRFWGKADIVLNVRFSPKTDIGSSVLRCRTR